MNPDLNRAICARMDATGMDGYAVVAEIRWEWRHLLSRFVPTVTFGDTAHWVPPGGHQAAQERLLEARRTRNTGPTIPRAQGAHRPRRIP